jgi:geranylgeranyl diphosphate synthase, type II
LALRLFLYNLGPMPTMMTHETVQDADRATVAAVEAWLAARLNDGLSSARTHLPPNLLEAIRYSLLSGGKMLRPLLAIRSCEAVGGSEKDAFAPAAALELIHAFSLVHDDLPAMDDDDLRRGRPTLHVHAGEAMAILAGDAMMSLAFEFIAQCGLDAARTNAITAELARGTSAMIAGQAYDTLGGFPSAMPDREKLVQIHRNKTGALIRAACRIGGHCGAASEGQMARLTEYGESIGLMFQIVDDVLDVTQSPEHIGKATGKDLDAGKLTYPGVLGLEESRREIVRLEKAALEAIETLGAPASPLANLCRFLAVRTK